MKTDTMAMFGLFVAFTDLTGTPAAVVPEPEFKRFKFPERKAVAVRAEEMKPANGPAAADAARAA